MKNRRNILLAALLLTASGSATAQTTAPAGGDLQSVGGDLQSPTQESVEPIQGRLLTSKISLLTRTHGDRVVLRWLPEDYVSWKFLVHSGVNVLRIDQSTQLIDTVALQLKPLTEAQFKAKYAQSDTLAAVAMGVLYGEGRLGEGNPTREKPGSQGANMELNNEQDLSFAYAMLAAEWRPDLAEAMAVGITDHTAQRGHTYDYIVQPSTPNFDGKIIFEPGVDEGVVNEVYKPLLYDPKLEYEQVAPWRVAVSWVDTEHSSYEVERREVVADSKSATADSKSTTAGRGTWQRLNTAPYVSMIQDADIDGLNIFTDSVNHTGVYEYRILAHDAFGQLTEPSPVLRARIRDMEAPKAPQLTRIIIERPDSDDPSSRVLAHVFWKNSPQPEADLQGYLVQYYNEQLTGRQWMSLPSLNAEHSSLIAPHDTTAVVDVTGLRTGMLCIAAYDDSGNEGQSLAQLIRITDYKAPAAPDSLRAITLPDGQVILSWQPKNEDTDIEYFDLAFANQPDHDFLNVTDKGLRQSFYVDSLALDVNQKYIYYRVRAVDYSGNFGPWTEPLRVLRPHVTPPTKPHLDESSHSDGIGAGETPGMHMRWIVGKDADMTYHLVYRRLGDSGDYELLSRHDHDSIAALGTYAIVVDDNPPYDTRQRYYYMVESYNSSPYTAQSVAVSWLHRGPRYYDIPIKLSGAWVEHDGMLRLVWDHAALPAELRDRPYYYCVFRRAEGDKRFSYMINVPSDTQEYTDRTLLPGQKAEYYVTIHFRDGRDSRDSNVVTITNTNKQ